MITIPYDYDYYFNVVIVLNIFYWRPNIKCEIILFSAPVTDVVLVSYVYEFATNTMKYKVNVKVVTLFKLWVWTTQFSDINRVDDYTEIRNRFFLISRSCMPRENIRTSQVVHLCLFIIILN